MSLRDVDLEVVEAVLGPKKSKILKNFVSVRGWPGNIFEVFWWSFGVFCDSFSAVGGFIDNVPNLRTHRL